MDNETKKYIDAAISKVIYEADHVFGKVDRDMKDVKKRLKRLEG